MRILLTGGAGFKGWGRFPIPVVRRALRCKMFLRTLFGITV